MNCFHWRASEITCYVTKRERGYPLKVLMLSMSSYFIDILRTVFSFFFTEDAVLFSS